MEVNTFRQHTVYVRHHWADEWATVTGLKCDAFEECCGPSMSSAAFQYDYGRVKDYASQVFVDKVRLDINGWYVKVQMQQLDEDTGLVTYRYWYGIIVDTTTEQMGNADAAPFPPITQSGHQSLKALGLEYLLEREIYDSAFAKTSSGAELEFERGLAFNMGGSAHNSRRIHGNKSSGFGEKENLVTGGSPHIFSSELNTAEEWSVADILQYLLIYHPPRDDNELDRIGWYIHSMNGVLNAETTEAGNAILVAVKPKLDVHGQSVRAIIDQMFDRRRCMGWKVQVRTDGDGNEHAGIDLFTFNEDELELIDGDTQEPNSNQVSIAFADDPRVTGASIFTSSSSRFDRVTARGDRVILCLSLQSGPETGQGTLVKDWTDTLKDEYNGGAVGSAGYSSADLRLKVDANKAARDAQRLQRVYRYFLWKPANVNTEIPAANEDDELLLVNNKLLVCWPPGGRFMQDLPLRYDLDYTTPETDITDDKPDDSVTDYMAPFAVIKDGSIYYNMHTMGRGQGNAPLIERHWTASLQMRRDQLGIIVDVQGEPGQHAIAKDEFVAADADDEAKGNESDLRWQYIIATVALELDNWAEATYPEPDTPLIGDDDTVKTLIVNVPDRQMHYVAKNTVFGLSDGGALYKTSEGGWIRDDSWELKWLARIAYEWYKVDRKAFEYTFASLDCPYEVGQLVTTLTTGDAVIDVNSVITSITFDLLAGTYTLKTSFAELDPRGVL